MWQQFNTRYVRYQVTVAQPCLLWHYSQKSRYGINPSPDEWIMNLLKMWSLNTIEYYLTNQQKECFLILCHRKNGIERHHVKSHKVETERQALHVHSRMCSTGSEITGKSILKRGVVYVRCNSMSITGYLDLLKTCPLWGVPFPWQGTLACKKVEKPSWALVRVHLLLTSSDWGHEAARFLNLLHLSLPHNNEVWSGTVS